MASKQWKKVIIVNGSHLSETCFWDGTPTGHKCFAQAIGETHDGRFFLANFDRSYYSMSGAVRKLNGLRRRHEEK